MKRVETAIRQSRLQRILKEEVEIRPGSIRTLHRRSGDIDRYGELVGRCESITRPFWQDLVNPDDYFQPRAGWMHRDPQPVASTDHRVVIQPTDGDFVVSFNPEFPAIGDFVTRALFHRVEILNQILDDARQAVLSAVQTSGRSAPKVVSQAVEDSSRLNETVLSLQTACRPTEDFSIRESCVVLAQIYAFFIGHRKQDGLDYRKLRSRTKGDYCGIAFPICRSSI